jgi:predicted nucleic acid-binding Zn ribbon protein
MNKICIICGTSEFEIKSERFCSQKCIHRHGSIQATNTKVKCEICNKEFSSGTYKRHLNTHKSKEYHYFCENCGKECFKNYGSGRFCSKECAKGFSTKAKRKEINKKVSIRIKEKIENGEKIGWVTSGRLVKLIEKECPVCFEKFISDEKFGNKTCSKKCAAINGGKNNLGKKHKMGDTSRMGGLRPGGGKSKQIPYTNWLGYKMSLNKEEIEVAKILDNRKIIWNRNKKGFPYITKEGNQRNYYPDFIINDVQYIEYKGWITDEMTHKMEDAKTKNNLNLLIVVSSNKRYVHMGISIDELKTYNLDKPASVNARYTE